MEWGKLRSAAAARGEVFSGGEKGKEKEGASVFLISTRNISNHTSCSNNNRTYNNNSQSNCNKQSQENNINCMQHHKSQQQKQQHDHSRCRWLLLVLLLLLHFSICNNSFPGCYFQFLLPLRQSQRLSRLQRRQRRQFQVQSHTPLKINFTHTSAPQPTEPHRPHRPQEREKDREGDGEPLLSLHYL